MRRPTLLGALARAHRRHGVQRANPGAQRSPHQRSPPPATSSRDVDPDALSGGATTVFDATAGAFGHPAPNLDAASLARHNAGDDGVRSRVRRDAGLANSGLGPLFNNNACEACHVGDGRGRPPRPRRSRSRRCSSARAYRAGQPRRTEARGPVRRPISAARPFQAISPEAAARVTYADSGGRYDDGTSYSLRVPRYSFQGILAPLPATC